jgi:Protein kinase domain
MAPPALAPPARPDSSLVAGRYRPLRPLGSGGSGSVWLARDEDRAQEVALKVVRREGKAASRAEREVEAASRLRHPRCLRALAFDRDDEHVYVAYEYVRGRTLRDALRSGEVDDAAAVETAAQMLEALAHAHGKGVVHRDVKPANVMLEEGDAVSARLLDFGLAHLQEAETLTAAGDVPGTLAYVSPERLAGSPPAGSADVWAVGVVLWEALAGWHPFTAASPVETARRIAAGAQPLARLRPDLPTGLCSLVDRMLALEPRRRPAAARLPGALREAFAARSMRRRPATSRRALRERALPAALATVYAGGGAALLPFFPRGGPLVVALLAGVLALRAPRAGVALALAAPVLPLGNVALGLALVYALLAAGWLAAFARDPRGSLLFLAGPLLAPLGVMAAVPLAAQRAHGALRRAATAVAATLAAGTVAAVARTPFPLGGAPPALPLRETARPDAALERLLEGLAAWPGVALLALVLAAATLALPAASARGLWGMAFWGSGLVAAGVLLPAGLGDTPVTAAWLVPGAWAATLLLAAQAHPRVLSVRLRAAPET